MMIPKPIRLTRMVMKRTKSGRDNLLRQNRDLLDHDRLHRHVVMFAARMDRRSRDLVDDLHPREHAAEDSVAEVGWRESTMIELTVVGDVHVELRGCAAEHSRARHRHRAAD